MRKLKLLSLLMLIAFSVGTWADTPAAVGTTLFSEDFSGYSANDVPSGSVTTATGRAVYGDASVTYTCTDGGSTTKIYNENTGGGTAPEILVSKGNGSLAIAGIPSGGAQAITVSWTQNKQALDVAPSGTGYSGSVSGKPANAGTRSFDITVADGADATFTLTFTGSGSSNVRVDDIVVTVKTAGEGGAPAKTLTSIAVSGAPTKTSYYAGDEFDPAGLTVTGTYSDASTGPISSGITWTYNPSQTLVKDQTSIGVIATVSEIASAEYNVTGLTVTAASPKITITQDEVADFTNTYAEYTWTAGGVSGKMYAYKNAGMQFNSSKTGYYVYNTDAIPGRITKITMTKASGTDRSWTPYVSSTAMTAPVAEKALDAQTVTSTGVSWDVTGSNSYFYLTVAGGSTVIGSIVIEYTEDAPPAIDAPSISGDVNFVGSTTVTISHDDADHIYYTTNGVDPTTSSAEYTAPFVVNADGTTTVKAIAVKGSDVSEVASKGFTKVTALESLAALLDATTSTETAFNVVVTDWVVTGVQGTRAWIADAANEKGILLYKSGHGFVAGNKLNGVVIGTKTKLYQGYPEMTTLVSTDVTVTSAETITPRTTTIAALTSGHPAEQGTVVKLENLTYTASTTSFSDGVNTLALNTQLYNPTMLDGAIYTIIGVVRYDNEAAISIMPRSVDDVEQTGGGGLPEVTGLAALKAETTGSSYLLNLTDAIVTLVDGSNAFIEDATAGALIYKSGHGFNAGDKLNGQYEVTTATYQGKFEITAIAATTGTKTTDAEIPVTTLTIAQLNANFAANESKRIKIVGVNVTDAVESGDATARTGEISDGANTITLYAGKSGVTAAENANIDVVGYPTFHNTDQQLAVWAQADITVNEKEDPELAYDPVSETIEQGASWSAPTLVNPHSLTIASYASNNESVATVTDEGVIALAGGLGTAVITAHTDGDATYAAGNATYTITVNEYDSRKIATGSAFTAISGDLTPADIQYAAYKGDGTSAPVVRSTDDPVTIRIYKPASGKATGGYITVKAKVGCTIDQVKITFSGNATAAYCKDDEELPTSAYITGQAELLTPTGLSAQSVSVVNLKNGSIDISEIKVYYTGDALTIDHYILGGTYETTFEQNGTFNYDGLTVTAAYDAGETITEAVTGFTVEADLTTAGNKKAEVYLGAVKIAEYDITVTAGKEDPALAYTPSTQVVEAADIASWTAPAFSNEFSVSPITYTSSKESVAKVTDAGVITLEGGYGKATITAHFAGNDDYIESTATYEITVNEPADDLSGTWTLASSIAAGDVIIIASIADGTDVLTMGEQKSSNRGAVASTVSGTTLTPAAGTKVLTVVDAGDDKFAFQATNGNYIYASSNSSNQLKETDAYATNDNAKWAISFDGDNVATIDAQGSNGRKRVRYNPNSGNPLFACYATDATTGTLVTVYKKDVPAPVYTDVRTGLTAGNYYTICHPKAMTAIKGATLWQFVSRDASFAYIEQASAPFVAGRPYIIYATSDKLEAVEEGDAVTTAGSNGALHGTFTNLVQENLDGFGADVYLIIGNQLRLVSGQSLNTLPANRAYVKLSDIPEQGAPAPMPGRQIRSMSLPKNTPTGLENGGLLNGENGVQKVLINGNLYILRGEKMYDATGRLVK